MITGASGFVGFHLIAEALKNNLEVYAAVRRSSKIDHLKDFSIRYVYPDFDDMASLINDLQEKQYRYIIHAAGITKARSSDEYQHVNAEYTYNLALAVVKSEIELKKFVLISSLAALGPLNNLKETLTEETVPRPVTAYGKSKLLSENKLKTFASLNYTILRPTGVYGPRDRDILIFFKQLSKGIEPYIGNFQQTYSFIYVTDLAKAAIKALFAGNKKTYNLSDGNNYDRYELGNMTKQALKKKTLKFHLSLRFVKAIARLSEFYSLLSNKASALNVEKLNELGAVSWSCSIANAKADLGYQPAYDLQKGVAVTIKWYKANKWL